MQPSFRPKDEARSHIVIPSLSRDPSKKPEQMKPHCKHILICAIAVFAAMSCSDGLDIPYSTRTHGYGSSDGSASRAETELKKRTLLLYSAGYNSLSASLTDDIDDICDGYVPYGYPYCDNLLIFASNYNTGRTPCLIKVYRTRDEEVVRDTVRFWPEGTSAVDTETLAEVLSYVKDNYPSAEYGMIFSSHATGWLPEGTMSSGEFPSAGEDSAEPQDEGRKMQRSIGQDISTKAEMDVKDFAAAIPFKLKYIIFDACLMGGVETAYELRDKCEHLVFSQAEILADGMVYTNMVNRLLGRNPSDIVGVAEDYFTHYDSMTGDDRSATISVVDCSGLESLADACKVIFDAQKGAIPGISPGNVQLANYRTAYFYDFRDILTEIMPEEELADVDAALERCIEYKANTEYFFSDWLNKSFRFETFCGLSMYLPSAVSSSDREDSNAYYSKYQWAQDTGYLAGYYL